jgi:hypothetical protein
VENEEDIQSVDARCPEDLSHTTLSCQLSLGRDENGSGEEERTKNKNK